MPDIKNICVFCGSSQGDQEAYKEAAQALGHYIADKGFGLVYGGAKAGIMGVLADTALSGGASVTGVMPEHLKVHELVHEGLDQLHITENMQERQTLMADLSDVFVILPGGLGTVAEFFEIVNFKALGLHKKPIILLNINGYWNNLLGLMNQMSAQKFMKDSPDQLYKAIFDVSDLDNVL